MRILHGGLGLALMVVGSVAALQIEDGVLTASFLAAGLALMVVGYLGPYITRIKIKEFEAELERGVRRFREGVETELESVREKS
jgi:hypothetical protein